MVSYYTEGQPIMKTARSDRGREICAFRNRARRPDKNRKRQRPAARRKAIADSRRDA
jgi:hypothetical protein